MTGIGNAFGFLGQSLTGDWNGAFNNVLNPLSSTMDWLNMLSSIKFGTPYVPMSSFGNTPTTFGGDATGGLFGPVGTSFNNTSPFSWNTNSGFGLTGTKGNGSFGGTNLLGQSFNRNLNTYTPIRLSRQQVSNVVGNGGGSAVGWRGSGTTRKNTTPTNANNGRSGRGHGTSTSDYKSHQKERAIPKQININIQNLMKVDSIDMTNENNVAIIEKLKEKVAYALYEAAADGTMMLNGLSNT